MGSMVECMSVRVHRWESESSVKKMSDSRISSSNQAASIEQRQSDKKMRRLSRVPEYFVFDFKVLRVRAQGTKTRKRRRKRRVGRDHILPWTMSV